MPLLVGLFLGLAALAGCGSQSPGSRMENAPPPPPRNALPPAGCPATVSDPDQAQRALNGARPGDVVCLTGPGLLSVSLKVIRSGLPGVPVRILSDGAEVRGVDVRADYVEVAGFTVREGGGLNLRGTGLDAHDNNVWGARRNGISCTCADSRVEGNEVYGTEGTGIRVEGELVSVRRNTVSGSVPDPVSGEEEGDGDGGNDADGVRFFGSGLRISDNVVRDISMAGYPPGKGPHPDCFQTFDTDAPPTFDVEISGNRCERVAEQCLIGTGKKGNPGVPAGVRSITFVANYCDVGGAQAISLAGYPHVELRGNTLAGPKLYRGIALTKGASDAVVTDNVVVGDHPVLEADPDSTPTKQENNRTVR